jgi:hypothetical protein
VFGRWFFRFRLWFGTHRGQGLVLLAGFALIMVGILCLCLSALVADAGSWWQGTLDAFGVGFIVGGVIDVLAIFGLNVAIKAEDEEREKFNSMARDVLELPVEDAQARRMQALKAGQVLSGSGGLMDQDLKTQLNRLVTAEETVWASLIEMFSRPSPDERSLDEIFDLPPDGDAPREPEVPEPPDHLA